MCCRKAIRPSLAGGRDGFQPLSLHHSRSTALKDPSLRPCTPPALISANAARMPCRMPCPERRWRPIEGCCLTEQDRIRCPARFGACMLRACDGERPDMARPRTPIRDDGHRPVSRRSGSRWPRTLSRLDRRRRAGDLSLGLHRRGAAFSDDRRVLTRTRRHVRVGPWAGCGLEQPVADQ
jgi:hypothetical protein